jgi:hypothetical protein
MKNIKLTEKHKTKLLEMCKVLFPEYSIRLTKPLYSTPDTYFVQIGKKQSNMYNNEIHWFEFCMTYLYQRIKQISGGNINYHSCIRNEHPIDYLYKEFKKLS